MDIKQLRAMLLIAPFHKWLGLEIAALTEDALILEMPWRDEMISNPALPSMHGGILASLIDLTGFYAVLASGNMCKSTADLRVDYHRAASRQTLRCPHLPLRFGLGHHLAAHGEVGGEALGLSSTMRRASSTRRSSAPALV